MTAAFAAEKEMAEHEKHEQEKRKTERRGRIVRGTPGIGQFPQKLNNTPLWPAMRREILLFELCSR